MKKQNITAICTRKLKFMRGRKNTIPRIKHCMKIEYLFNYKILHLLDRVEFIRISNWF